GLEKDDRGAARLFKLAANQGNAIGQANIGVPFLDRVEKEARLDRARLEVSASKPFFNETDPLDIRFAAGEPRALYCWVLDSDVTAAVFLPIRGIEATRMLMPGERHYPSGFGLDEVRLDEPRVNLIDCFAARTRLPPELDARWLEAAPSKETDYNPEPLSAPDVLELLNKMRALPGIVEGTARLVVR